MSPLFKIALLAISLTLLCGCQAPQEQPIIDRQGVNQAQYEQDLHECRRYAEEAATGKAVVIGATTGAVIGGAVGAVLDNGRAAVRGAGTGAILGGTKGGFRNLERRQRIVTRCLTGRGYRVLG